MGGTLEGGRKTRDKNLAKDPDYYKKIGAIGGKNGRTGGFGAGEKGRAQARVAGRTGGLKSRRTKSSELPN